MDREKRRAPKASHKCSRQHPQDRIIRSSNTHPHLATSAVLPAKATVVRRGRETDATIPVIHDGGWTCYEFRSASVFAYYPPD